MPASPTRARSLPPAPTRYQAGAHIADIERRFGLSRVIKLASNENPLGPSPRALGALAAAGDLHRYPEADSDALRLLLAERLGLDQGRVLVSGGTTGLIDAVLASPAAAGGEVLLFERTFIYYRISARNHGRLVREVPRGPDFAYDIDALLRQIGRRTRVVFLAAPDNPTGVYLGRADLLRILGALPPRATLVFDEAYREYVPRARYFDPTAIADPRLLVLRTFSKAHGLAGLRCGYAVGNPALIEDLARRQAPFSVSAQAQRAAAAALLDEEHLRRAARLNARERARLRRALARRGLPCIESSGNFLLFSVFPARGDEIYAELLRRGVIVRPLGAYGLDHHLRVSVGLPDENLAFLRHLSAVLSTTRSAHVVK